MKLQIVPILILAAAFSSWAQQPPPQKTAAPLPPAIDPACEKLLPPSSVKKLSGDTEVTLIPKGSIPAAGGTCNYAVSGGKTLILYVELNLSATPRDYQRYKTLRSYQKEQQEIAGLGDEAFSSRSYHQDTVVARKAKTLVALLGILDLDPQSPKFNKPHFKREQLIELARELLAGS